MVNDNTKYGMIAYFILASSALLVPRNLMDFSHTWYSVIIGIYVVLWIMILQYLNKNIKSDYEHQVYDHLLIHMLYLLGLPIIYYLILFKAYSILPAQVAQPLNMVWPILLVLLSIPLLGHKITWKSMGAMLLSFSGVILVSMQRGAPDLHPDNRLGVFLALASSVVWAFYFILNSRGKTDPVLRLFLNFAFASLYILVLSLFRENSFPFTSRDWLAAAYVGIFEMGITFVLWIMAIRMASSSDRISNLVYIAPFLNLLLAHFVLGETILLSTIYGIALLVSGIVIQSMLQKNAKRT